MDLEWPVHHHDRECRRREPRAQRPRDPSARRQRLSHHSIGPALGQPVKFLSGLSERLRDGLRRSQEYLAGSLGTVLDTDRPIDDALLEELEELLIAADLGAPLAADFVNRAREEVMFGTVTRADQLRPLFRRFLVDILTPAAKLAAALKSDGKQALLVAADTFRAAAIEQLTTWGDRVGVDVVRQAAGSDPAAV